MLFRRKMVSVQSTVDTGHEDMGKKLMKVPKDEKNFKKFAFHEIFPF